VDEHWEDDMRKHWMRALTVMAACATLAAPVFADETVSFKGKTITMIIPTTAGANTDLSARLFAKFFSKYLPGEPAAIAQNIPAAHGITALNYLAQQAKPDGLTVAMSSSSQVDPITYRAPAAKYDPALRVCALVHCLRA
jgi:tripartite-type tricarboxylate transporter receptor subunit TctC